MKRQFIIIALAMLAFLPAGQGLLHLPETSARMPACAQAWAADHENSASSNQLPKDNLKDLPA